MTKRPKRATKYCPKISKSTKNRWHLWVTNPKDPYGRNICAFCSVPQPLNGGVNRFKERLGGHIANSQGRIPVHTHD
jgi:hypothetical protein